MPKHEKFDHEQQIPLHPDRVILRYSHATPIKKLLTGQLAPDDIVEVKVSPTKRNPGGYEEYLNVRQELIEGLFLKDIDSALVTIDYISQQLGNDLVPTVNMVSGFKEELKQGGEEAAYALLLKFRHTKENTAHKLALIDHLQSKYAANIETYKANQETYSTFIDKTVKEVKDEATGKSLEIPVETEIIITKGDFFKQKLRQLAYPVSQVAAFLAADLGTLLEQGRQELKPS